eukprot:TRINITY_DN20346_c0_g1_i2.p2 TRINITY_DN20346_c0_g1~~TRINITY_DN20346_c0_g1_i2.p2  ORF type:complete len:116 (+),score=36.38 TRINITY_DN20346_c0_g1_i2:65-412(+)
MPARALVAPLAAIDALRQSGRSVGDGEAAAVLRLSAEYAEGAALLRRLRADGVRLGTCSYAALLEGCARRGEPEYAEAVLAEMQAKGAAEAAACGRCEARHVLLRSVAGGLREAG